MSKIEEVRDAMMAAFDAAIDGEDVSIPMARAAIEAMREPTDAMVDSGQWQIDPVLLYQSFIDAALSEEGR